MKFPSGTVVRAGGRIGVLLVHGVGGAPDDVAELADALAEAGCTVVCPLLSGHDATPAEFNAARWTEWYVSAEIALDHLADRCDVIVVGGVSASALLALRLAAEQADLVQGCMLFAPVSAPHGWAMPRTTAWLLRAAARLRLKRLADLVTMSARPPFGIKDEALRDSHVAHRIAAGRTTGTAFGRRGGTALEVQWLFDDVSRRLATISQPVQVFQPRDDDQGDLATHAGLQRRLAGRVEAVVLDDSYHAVLADRQRGLVIARAGVFVATVAREYDDAMNNRHARTTASRNG